MQVIIKETNEIAELLDIDYKTQTDMAADVINGQDIIGYDDYYNMYIMTAEAYNWWERLFADLARANERVEEMRETLDEDLLIEFEDYITYMDVEISRLPDALNKLCDEYEKLNED